MNTVDHIAGHTYHGRKGDIENAFRYSVDYVLLDPEADVETPWLFRRNSAGLASLHDRDFGGVPKQGIGAAWARDVLAHHAPSATGKLLFLTQPRFLGHVFNPVSFWLCHNESDELVTIIAEVSNTFGDRHSYICHHGDFAPICANDRFQSRKIFHVSPFQPVEGGYEFRFDIGPDRIGIWIDYSAGKGGLMATLTGTRKRLTNQAILWACLRRPFGSRRVLALIHWQALKLWWKKARFYPRPDPPKEEIS